MPDQPVSVSVNLFGFRVDLTNRMFEWHAALVMVGIATILLMPGDIARYGAFRLLYETGFSEEFMATAFLFVGMSRLSALAINGHIGPLGPRLRSIGAMFGSLIWCQLSISLFYEYYMTGRISIGVVVYVSFTLFDALSAYRAALDVRRVMNATE